MVKAWNRLTVEQQHRFLREVLGKTAKDAKAAVTNVYEK